MRRRTLASSYAEIAELNALNKTYHDHLARAQHSVVAANNDIKTLNATNARLEADLRWTKHVVEQLLDRKLRVV